MEIALSHPELGYYSRPDLTWGRNGDYETSPEVHQIFGYLWARQIEECWNNLEQPSQFDLIEVGAGSGAFASAILTWLRDRSPECFEATQATLLDGNPIRLEAQNRALQIRGFNTDHQLLENWLVNNELINGVIISNEFFDALPVHLVERRDNRLYEWFVEMAGSSFKFVLGDTSTPNLEKYFHQLGLQSGESSRAEVCLAAPNILRRITDRIGRGYLLTMDYGYEAKDLYASWRKMGTLMAFQNHSPQPDPLSMPGQLDLTAHVDFTTLARTAKDAGLEAAPTVSQAEALTALGLPVTLGAAEKRAHVNVARFVEERRAAAQLTDLTGLGRIRVLALAKDGPLEDLLCLRSIEQAYR